jgi:hypothetical protein
MMSVLFTKSDSPLSRLIRGVTGEPISHCALRWDELVVHSNLRGVHITHLHSFTKQSEILYEVPVIEDRNKLTDLLVNAEGSLYDVGALLFLGLTLWCRRYLHLPLPKSNLWQASGMYLCTEFVTKYIDREEDSMITPYKLYLHLQESIQ